jgi:alpha-aminoadipate/glutamate carrier protein LysW
MTNCEQCESILKVEDVTETGELVSCHQCGQEFEVVSLAPIQLQLAPMEDEDWGQ